jgi:hypothetical protein
MFWGGLHNIYVSEAWSWVFKRETCGYKLLLLSVEIGLTLLLSLHFASNCSEMENSESTLVTVLWYQIQGILYLHPIQTYNFNFTIIYT